MDADRRATWPERGSDPVSLPRALPDMLLHPTHFTSAFAVVPE